MKTRDNFCVKLEWRRLIYVFHKTQKPSNSVTLKEKNENTFIFKKA